MNMRFNKYQLILFGVITIICIKCGKEPHYPDAEVFNVFDNTLMPGFDIGVDDSRQQRRWLLTKDGFFEMKYPGELDWGCVYIVTGLAQSDSKVYEDFSNYKGFSVDLKGNNGSEFVGISIEDVDSKSSFVAKISNLNTDWQTFHFSFSNFPDINLKRLSVVIKFLFSGDESQTIDFKNLRYYSYEFPDTNTYEYYIVFGNNVMNQFVVGCNSVDSLNNWIFDKGTYWEMNFPPDQLWATLFLSSNNPKDFSMFDAMSFEIKGKNGREKVYVGINDTLGEDPSGRSFIQWTLNKDWEQVRIPLSWIKGINLSGIYIPIQFVIFNTEGQTIYFKNVKYIF